ncbi:glycerol dehydrogenase [Enterococcus sp. LJL99]
MEKLFVSPSKYVQGKGLLKSGIPYIKQLGTKALLLTDEFVWELVGRSFYERLLDQGMNMINERFNGETTEAEIQRIMIRIEEEDIEVILALGGGKLIDTGKALANELKLPVAIIPTTASTDAPTSSISVLYEADGRFKEYSFYEHNPELVLVDTEVVAKAPVRFLISGMADALATTIEARAVKQKNGQNVLGKQPTIAAQLMAEKCEEIIFTYGLQAVEANRAKVVTEALEAVIEANTLLSGIGFESAGLAAAHAIHNGFSAVQGTVHQLTHGEKVAFGTLTQLVLENQPQEILDKYIAFYQGLGLPTTLEEIGLAEVSDVTLLEIGNQALAKGDSLQQMPMTLSAEDIVAAMKTLDQYVQTYFLKA